MPIRSTPQDESTPSTELLMEKIKRGGSFQDFTAENAASFNDQTIVQHFDMLLKKYLVMKSEAVKRSGLERTYGYHVLAGNRNAGRDKLIRMAVGIGVTVEDAQRLLALAKEGSLYPKVKRDAAIIYALEHKMNIDQLQILLDEADLDLLE